MGQCRAASKLPSTTSEQVYSCQFWYSAKKSKRLCTSHTFFVSELLLNVSEDKYVAMENRNDMKSVPGRTFFAETHRYAYLCLFMNWQQNKQTYTTQKPLLIKTIVFTPHQHWKRNFVTLNLTLQLCKRILYHFRAVKLSTGMRCSWVGWRNYIIYCWKIS